MAKKIEQEAAPAVEKTRKRGRPPGWKKLEMEQGVHIVWNNFELRGHSGDFVLNIYQPSYYKNKEGELKHKIMHVESIHGDGLHKVEGPLYFCSLTSVMLYIERYLWSTIHTQGPETIDTFQKLLKVAKRVSNQLNDLCLFLNKENLISEERVKSLAAINEKLARRGLDLRDLVVTKKQALKK